MLFCCINIFDLNNDQTIDEGEDKFSIKLKVNFGG